LLAAQDLDDYRALVCFGEIAYLLCVFEAALLQDAVG
jgi:hypothetical protein